MRFYCVKLKSFRIIILLVIVLVMLAVGFNGSPAASVFFGYSSSSRKVPVYFVNTTKKQVAISFDAAWGADKTSRIMDICDEFNVKATFFLVGFWAEEYPDKVKEIASRGFEIGTHSNTHPDMTRLSKTQIKTELEESIKSINNVVDSKVELFRPPYGAYNDALIETASSLNLTTIQWDVDTLDWKGLSGGEICKRVLNGAKNGSIILCHNNSDHILDALPLILDRLQKQGYSVGTVGSLIYKNGKTDNNGMQSEVI